MAGALENRGKKRGLSLVQKKANNKAGALTLRGQDRDLARLDATFLG